VIFSDIRPVNSDSESKGRLICARADLVTPHKPEIGNPRQNEMRGMSGVSCFTSQVTKESSTE